MVANKATQPHPLRESVLHRLIRERGLERFELFFVTGEGRGLPGGLEETSGCVVDAEGRVFSFWMGWDPEQHRLALTEWEAEDPDPRWDRIAEYRRARQALGLGTD